jgi:hypothetical protein
MQPMRTNNKDLPGGLWLLWYGMGRQQTGFKLIIAASISTIPLPSVVLTIQCLANYQQLRMMETNYGSLTGRVN